MKYRKGLIYLLLMILWVMILACSLTDYFLGNNFASPTMNRTLVSFPTSTQITLTQGDIPGNTGSVISPQSPSETPGPSGSSVTNPIPAGSSGTANEMVFTVVSAIRPADNIVAAGNQFNPVPEPGEEFLMVEIEVQCTRQEQETCAATWFEFHVIGSRNVEYPVEMFVLGVPGIFNSENLTGGNSLSGDLYFLISQNEETLVLSYSPFYGPGLFLSLD